MELRNGAGHVPGRTQRHAQITRPRGGRARAHRCWCRKRPTCGRPGHPLPHQGAVAFYSRDSAARTRNRGSDPETRFTHAWGEWREGARWVSRPANGGAEEEPSSKVGRPSGSKSAARGPSPGRGSNPVESSARLHCPGDDSRQGDRMGVGWAKRTRAEEGTCVRATDDQPL